MMSDKAWLYLSVKIYDFSDKIYEFSFPQELWISSVLEKQRKWNRN